MFQIVDSSTLQKVQDASAQPCVAAIAAFFPGKGKGTVRLIDNMVVTPPTSKAIPPSM